MRSVSLVGRGVGAWALRMPNTSPKPRSKLAEGVIVDRYVRASAFTQRLGWASGTVYRKMYNTRKKLDQHQQRGLSLTDAIALLSPYDMPPPDNRTEEGDPRWLKSTLDAYEERYRAARSGDLPEAEEEIPTPPESP